MKTRQSPLRTALGAFCLAWGVALLIWTGLVFRFMHPELTETQLFVSQWPLIALGVGFLVLGSVGLRA